MRLLLIMALRNFVLGIGIFVVYLLMLAYGIEAFYSSPQYNDFCTGSESERYYPGKPYPSEYGTNCSTLPRSIREQIDACFVNEGQPIYEYDDAGCTTSMKECNYCNKEFNDARQEYEKRVFVIALIVGIVTLLIGYGMLAAEPVGSALMASGIGAIFYGSMRNWEHLSDILRFLLLFAALILLIWITIRANRPERKKAWQFWK